MTALPVVVTSFPTPFLGLYSRIAHDETSGKNRLDTASSFQRCLGSVTKKQDPTWKVPRHLPTGDP